MHSLGLLGLLGLLDLLDLGSGLGNSLGSGFSLVCGHFPRAMGFEIRFANRQHSRGLGLGTDNMESEPVRFPAHCMHRLDTHLRIRVGWARVSGWSLIITP